MARDIWTQDIRRFDIPDEDDDYSAPVVRSNGKALANEQAEAELRRQREVFEAEERRRADEAEQSRLQKLADSGEAVLIDVDAHRSEKQRIRQMNHQTGNERGRGA